MSDTDNSSTEKSNTLSTSNIVNLSDTKSDTTIYNNNSNTSTSSKQHLDGKAKRDFLKGKKPKLSAGSACHAINDTSNVMTSNQENVFHFAAYVKRGYKDLKTFDLKKPENKTEDNQVNIENENDNTEQNRETDKLIGNADRELVNQKDIEGNTPLLLACKNNFTYYVKKLLVKYDASVNIPNNNGDTPLHAACQRGNEDIVRLLIKAKNIDVNAKNKLERTPLFVACLNGHKDIVKILLGIENLSLNSKTGPVGETDIKKIWSPLSIACAVGNKNIIDQLFKKSESLDTSKVNKWDGSDVTKSLFYASKNGHHRVLDSIFESQRYAIPSEHLEKTNLVSVTEEYGTNKCSALIIASKYGHKIVVEAILKRIKIEKDCIAKYVSEKRKQRDNKITDIVKRLYLLFNHVDTSQKTALIHAAENKHSEIVNELLKKGADRTLVDDKNRNALIYACINGDENTVKYILRENIPVKKADCLKIEFDSKNEPLGDNESTILYKILRQQDNDGKIAIMHALENNAINVVKKLINFTFFRYDAKGERVELCDDIKDKEGSSVLHYAVASKNQEIVKIILERKAVIDTEVLDENKWSPINIAQMNKDTEIIKLIRTHVKLQSEKDIATSHFFGKT